MELEEMKKTWKQLGDQAQKQQKLNHQTIDKMTQKKYYNKLNNIAYPELAGGIICLLGAIFIALNFGKLDTLFLAATGVVAIALLLILPVVSYLSLWRLRSLGDVQLPYSENLRRFIKDKMRFRLFQQINVGLSFLFFCALLLILPVMMNKPEVTDDKYFWAIAFSVGLAFLWFFSRWVLKHYNRSLEEAQDLLKDLESK